MTEAIWRIPSLEEINQRLPDSKCPVVDRINAIFAARHHGDEAAVEAMSNGLSAESPVGASVLVRHEIAYNLGQCGIKSAIPILRNILMNEEEDEVTRHEAVEGLAALDDHESLPLLRTLVDHPSAPLRETAQLAVRSLEIKHPEFALSTHDGPDVGVCACTTGDRAIRAPGTAPQSQFRSIDPMAASEELLSQSVENLKSDILDANVPLWRRYQCLFALRDKPDGGEDAINAICEALLTDKSSAVLRHEIAYVLGQIQSASSYVALEKCLRNEEEHPMARHEAALALGSVGTKECIKLLNEYCSHSEPMVSESCVVGLDYMGLAPGESR